MTLSFAWATADDTFDPARHTHNDLNIFDITIQEKEGEYPRAILSIDPEQFQEIPESGSRKAFISWLDPSREHHLLFQGFPVSFPVGLKSGLAQLQLIARPPDGKEQLEELDFQHHPLFLKKPQQRFQNDYQLSSIYCCRKTLQLSRSDLFWGRETQILEGTHFKDSLKLTMTSPPFSDIRIFLTVQWIQKASGLANIGQDIAQQFPEGQMASYSDLKLKRGALTPGRRLGRSGFWVVRSNLKRIQSLVSEEHEGALPLHHYDWNFWVGWRYQQKRIETVEIHLPHRTQHLNRRETKEIHISLNNPAPNPNAHPWLPGVVYCPGTKIADGTGIYICRQQHLSQISRTEDEACWEFIEEAVEDPGFEDVSLIPSEHGQEIIKYSLKMARHNLAQSARCVRVSFQGSWEDFHHITTDMSLNLRDPTLPGGFVVGKVVDLKLRNCGHSGGRWVEVTLACAVGLGDTAVDDLPHYELVKSEEAPDGLVAPPQRFVQQLHVTNGPQRQEELLRTQEGPARTRILEDHPTRVQFQLTDLRSRSELRQSYRVEVPNGWSAPRQINL